MNKPVAVIEFGTRQIKLIVGYVINKKVYVLNTKVQPYGDIPFESSFDDKAQVAQAIKKIVNFYEFEVKQKINISSAIVCLPAKGFEVKVTNSTVTLHNNDVISESYYFDLINKVKKEFASSKTMSGDKLITIIPMNYKVNDAYYTTFPDRMAADEITLKCQCHVVPKDLFREYTAMLNESGIQVSRVFVGPAGSALLFKLYPNICPNYFLVDIGSNTTTVNVVSNGVVYYSKFIHWGSENITRAISNAFGVDLVDAEKYKITYGLDYRKMNFKAPIATIKNEENESRSFYREDLNAVIEKELEEFYISFNKVLEDLKFYVRSDVESFGFTFTGGGSMLNGLKEFFEDKLDTSNILMAIPTSLGARNPSYSNCLGCILCDHIFKDSIEENAPKIATLTRGAAIDENKER